MNESILQPAEQLKKAKDLEYLNEYSGKWVRVRGEKVVASGDTLREVMPDQPEDDRDSFVFKVPTPEETLIVLFLND